MAKLWNISVYKCREMKCANKKLTFSYLWPNVNFLLGQQCTGVCPYIFERFGLWGGGHTGVWRYGVGSFGL